MSAPLLSVRNLRVEYRAGGRGSTCAVDDVSFDIKPGEVLGLAGESGSGKSTIAYAILRLLKPPAVITGGAVELQGKDVLGMSEEALRRMRWRSVSLVFQSAMNALNPVTTLGEQLTDVLEAHQRITRRAAMDRAGELLELVGIDRGRVRSYPHELSGGMRQRAVIAIALALEPPLIIMDEPTTALDVVVQKEILAQISKLKSELGISILFITHDLSLLLEFSNRIGILYAGQLVETAESGTLLSAPLHPYTQGLLASFPSVRGPRQRLEGIGGAPPDMRNPPSGCRFHPRCALATERCRGEEPRLREVGVCQLAACHLLRGAGEPSARQPEREVAHVGAE